MAATKTALSIIQLCFHYFCHILAYTFWETKQRDAAVAGSFTPVSLSVNGDDQFANLLVLLQNAMTLDTHESAEPLGVLCFPNSLSNFSQLALSSGIAAASELTDAQFRGSFICAK